LFSFDHQSATVLVQSVLRDFPQASVNIQRGHLPGAAIQTAVLKTIDAAATCLLRRDGSSGL
jgi:hypothetical protein